MQLKFKKLKKYRFIKGEEFYIKLTFLFSKIYFCKFKICVDFKHQKYKI